jgi:uncharacterized protein (DUF1810 family)
MDRADPVELKRFVAAQAPVIDAAVAELRAGRKRSHWMWFVFPQLRGLGRSATADLYGIGSIEEAKAYLAHPTLGPRLFLCTEAVLGVEGRSAASIFGSPDDLKFRSCMTLFAVAAGEEANVFTRALDRFFDGRRDEQTLALLRSREPSSPSA